MGRSLLPPQTHPPQAPVPPEPRRRRERSFLQLAPRSLGVVGREVRPHSSLYLPFLYPSPTKVLRRCMQNHYRLSLPQTNHSPSPSSRSMHWLSLYSSSSTPFSRCPPSNSMRRPQHQWFRQSAQALCPQCGTRRSRPGG